MTAATIQSNDSNPTYTTRTNPDTKAFYVSTVNPDSPVGIQTELLVECAGPIENRSLVVFDRQPDGGIVGIEVLDPVNVEKSEKDGKYSIELTVGSSDEDLITIENGVSFEAPEWDRYPGLEVDYTPAGQMVALRVDETVLVTA